MSDLALRVEALTIDVGDRTLFSGLDLRVQVGEAVAVLGESGSGKTTLLNCVLGAVTPQSGTVTVAGQDVTDMGRRALARLRASKVGMVFQHGELIGELTAVQNVALPALLAGLDRDSAEKAARSLLEQFGVPEAASSQTLSGGERQRTALARALINSPALILADEPTGSLDGTTRDKVADVLFGAPQRTGCGLLVVTHDPEIAARADRTVELASRPAGTALQEVAVGE